MTDYIYPHTVAICTLADDTLNTTLQTQVAENPEWEGLIIAPLTTENIGIEQIIEFALGQPQLRTLILCGNDAEQAIGWHPGGTLLALGEHGIIGADNRVVNAPGKRPVLKNLTPNAIHHFRQQVHLIDCIGEQDPAVVIEKLQTALTDNLPKFEKFEGQIKAETPTIHATADGTITSDPAGYVVIDITSGQLTAQHFAPQGELVRTITGDSPKAIYMALIEHNAISRLDHAAYLGRELARAQACLNTNQPYTQDDAL